uniref:Putative secreted protein n=1 Tax=Anopheles marajoara TaxID=58244 RepID=A0A2M4CEC3_9DIPT
MISSSPASTVATFVSASVLPCACTREAVPASTSIPSSSDFSSFLTTQSDPAASSPSPYCCCCCSTFTWSE